MKELIFKIVDKYFNFVFDMKTDQVMEQENLKHLYKARRMGYRKKDMSEYWYDLRIGS